MIKSMLLAFVKEMEHDYESLFEGKLRNVEAVENALGAVNHRIGWRIDQEVGDDESEEEKKEKDYSDDGFGGIMTSK